MVGLGIFRREGVRRLAAAALLGVFCPCGFFAAMPVFDPTNWLTAIDTLYSSYDMVMNTIKQVEQAYTQYQHFVEQARSWDLDGISWDGDWDFRDELGDVTKSINRQLTNIRSIEELFTTRQYTMGGMSFTVRDLMGLGDADKDITDIVRNAGGLVRDTFSAAADAMVAEMTDEQKMAIWRKYGLSPRNFVYMQQKKRMVGEAMGRVLARTGEEAERAYLEAVTQGGNAIVDQALGNGEHTEKELQQQTILMLQELIKAIGQLGIDLNNASSLTALMQELQDEKGRQTDEEVSSQLRELDRPKADTMFLY